MGGQSIRGASDLHCCPGACRGGAIANAGDRHRSSGVGGCHALRYSLARSRPRWEPTSSTATGSTAWVPRVWRDPTARYASSRTAKSVMASMAPTRKWIGAAERARCRSNAAAASIRSATSAVELGDAKRDRSGVTPAVGAESSTTASVSVVGTGAEPASVIVRSGAVGQRRNALCRREARTHRRRLSNVGGACTSPACCLLFMYPCLLPVVVRPTRFVRPTSSPVAQVSRRVWKTSASSSPRRLAAPRRRVQRLSSRQATPGCFACLVLASARFQRHRLYRPCRRSGLVR